MTEVLDPPAQLPARQNGGGNALSRPKPRTALGDMALRFQIDPARLMEILKSTIVKGPSGRPATDDEAAAFVLVANQYKLNPFTREIHAFADGQKGIVPIVGIDGWANLVNSEPRYDGSEFEEAEGPDGKPIKITCVMYVKDRSHPIKVTERYSECRRNTGPWNQMPFRMLRHKAFMQAARLAFSISGIYDEDEARDIINGTLVSAETLPTDPASRLNGRVAQSRRPVSEGQQLVNEETGEVIPTPQAAADLQSHDFARPEPEQSEAQEPAGAGAEAQPPAEASQGSAAMSDSEKWFARMIELGESVELPEAKVLAGIAQWAKKTNILPGKEHLAKAKDLRDLEASIKEKRGWFAVA